MNITRKTLIGFCITVCGLVAQTSSGADIDAGKKKAAVCFTCHGETGEATLPKYPNLAGQNLEYLQIAMKAYRNGNRADPVMSPLAKPLSDRDIADISAYFAQFR